jgi:hypothetical protein
MTKVVTGNVPDIFAEDINDETRASKLSNVADQNALLCKSLLKVLDDIPLQL